MGKKERFDVLERFTLWTDDEADETRFLALVDRIGADNVEFLARFVDVDVPFSDMTTWEKIREYLTPALMAIACLIADRLMLWLLK